MSHSQLGMLPSSHSNSQWDTINYFFRNHWQLIAALVSGLLILLAWLFEHFDILQHVWLVYLVAFVIGGYAKAREGIQQSIAQKDLNVELLMLIAAIGAASIQHWLEGSMLIFIFSLSGALETYTTAKSTKAIEALMTLQPEEARLIHNGIEKMIPTSKLVIGDTIMINPGERIPSDGVIVKGASAINEATITGESMPVFKQYGNAVLAGTMNIDGSIHVKVTKESQDTLFHRILDLVQHAQSEKAPSQLFIEKIEGNYVKVVLIVAVLLLIFPPFTFDWTWSQTVYRAMVFLVVASPCALVASTMPAVLSAISYGAKQGILVKGGTHLEVLANLKAIAFDKTGTLTNGTPQVVNIYIDDDHHLDDLLKKVAALEAQSTHPLATAIIDYANHQSDRSTPEALKVKTIAGHGVMGTIDGHDYKIGKHSFVNQNSKNHFINKYNISHHPEQTLVYVEENNHVICVISLKDSVRQSTKQAIQTMNQMGIHTVMLTGDSSSTAEVIAGETGVIDYFADLLPAEKVEILKKLKESYHSIGMIGDGINDTPALATASVGVAMGEGTDAALETADIVLVKNDLTKMSHAIKLSKKMNRIIKQNITFSLTVIILLILANFWQILSMTIGVIGHEGSTILVILNGLRLLKAPK